MSVFGMNPYVVFFSSLFFLAFIVCMVCETLENIAEEKNKKGK